jgi:tetratricopeptide (TPR) repeat protein
MNSCSSPIIVILGTTRERVRRVTQRPALAGLVLSLLFVIPAHAQSYESELRLGVVAYKNARYEEAIAHFRKATELDPTQINAHVYLATAFTGQYIPGVQTDDNRHYAEGAIEQYKIILDFDAPQETKLSSAKGIGFLYLNMKKFEESKDYYKKALTFDASDPEPYYSIGVLDWTACYQPRMEARARLGLAPGDNLDATIPVQKQVCEELREKNTSLIEDAIDNLNKAIRLRPDYDDAMAYLNLMHREKADLECESPEARQEDLKTAEHWVDETIRVKKMKAEKSEHVPPPPPPPPSH